MGVICSGRKHQRAGKLRSFAGPRSDVRCEVVA
jgi:hypothetical protein